MRIKTVCTSVFFCYAMAILPWAASSALAGESATWRFDCGPAGSSVMKGCQPLTDADMYDQAKGYGWEGTKPEAQDWGTLPEFKDYVLSSKLPARLTAIPAYFREYFDELNRDGVFSANDLTFRADVPNGTYRVTVTVGDMLQTIGSMNVSMNGRLVAQNVAAWRPGAKAGGQKMHLMWGTYGGWTYVRGTVEAKDGFIRVSMAKDQTYYDQQVAEQKNAEIPTEGHYLSERKGDPPYWYVGWPFVHNSIMAIEIVPDNPAPVIGKEDSLSLTRPVNSPALQQAIALFNKKDFAAAEKALEQANEAEAQAAKAIVQLWIAGRPEVENEKALVAQARKVLAQYVPAHPGENGVSEILQDVEIFSEGMALHDGRTEMGKDHFAENNKAIGWWWMIQEDSPLYYKTQLYIGRACHMLMPFTPIWATEKKIFEKLEKKFPDNRYVKYHLHLQWSNTGDGTHPRDWVAEDYLAKAKDAPEWARELYASCATLVDFSEWWIKFKQRETGAIGGGWGDDVEIAPLFGYMGYLGRGVSPVCIDGMRKFATGVWTLSEVDPELGYCQPNADAEHTAEWTGNTMGMMLQIDFGSPTAIERAMKTAKLIRDLWTDYNKQGRRHFRANFFGAASVGSGDQTNDAWINYRAVRPATAVLNYNQNPSIKDLYVELADSWLAAALSTERGKPKGVIPAQVSFPEGILGGTNSPNWYTASHPEGTINYDWDGGYKPLLLDIFTNAYFQTRDPKYFEPLRLECELAGKYGLVPETRMGARLQAIPGEEPVKNTQKDGKAAEKTDAEPGSEEWVARKLKMVEQWPAAKSMMEGRKGALENDIAKSDIIRKASYANKMMREHWPLMTTEAGPTDRVAFGGILNPFFIYTGGGWGGPLCKAAVTYENTTKDFAAAVMGGDPQGLRILYYSFAPEAREIGLVPWELEPGGKYVLRYGPDANEDEKMDSVAEERTFDFPQWGTPVRLTLPPRKTYLIEIEQVERGKGPRLAPDPGLDADDIRYGDGSNLLMTRIHNVGAKSVRNVDVAFYDGDPNAGGVRIGSASIPFIDAPNDLTPKTTTVGVNWKPSKESHDIYVVVDPDKRIEGEITTFNNVAHKTLAKKTADAPKK